MIKNFNKKDISIILNNEIGYSINYSKKIINDLIYILSHYISKSELNIKNFGKFKIVKNKKKNWKKSKNKRSIYNKFKKIIKIYSFSKF